MHSCTNLKVFPKRTDFRMDALNQNLKKSFICLIIDLEKAPKTNNLSIFNRLTGDVLEMGIHRLKMAPLFKGYRYHLFG